MGIETKYEYTYYTVIDTEQWRTGIEAMEEVHIWPKSIDFINYKLKNSEDKSVNKYRVDYAGYEQDIGDWIRIHERHKERPIFVQFQDDQSIKTTGEGSLFVLYEEEQDDDDTNESISVRYDSRPDHETSWHDGLAGAGGRL